MVDPYTLVRRTFKAVQEKVRYMVAAIKKNWNEVVGEHGISDAETLDRALESRQFLLYRELLPTHSNYRLAHKLVFSDKALDRGYGEDSNPEFVNREGVKHASAKYIQEKEQRDRMKKRMRRRADGMH